MFFTAGLPPSRADQRPAFSRMAHASAPSNSLYHSSQCLSDCVLFGVHITESPTLFTLLTWPLLNSPTSSPAGPGLALYVMVVHTTPTPLLASLSMCPSFPFLELPLLPPSLPHPRLNPGITASQNPPLLPSSWAEGPGLWFSF